MALKVSTDLSNLIKDNAANNRRNVQEIGRYIDFHATTSSTADFTKRIDAGAGTTARTITIPDESGTMQMKPTNLYNNDSGSGGTITLSQTAANFTRLRIYYRDWDSFRYSTDVYSPNGKVPLLLGGYVALNSNIVSKFSSKTISGTSITNGTSGESSVVGNNYAYNTQYTVMYITRVDGYK